ncbi:nitroreductase/quinone reductase family protein [Nocardioides sp. Iso805N]|uniref:nitroreductase/quinone reductase family protein n=1 Tax=Nocardioides sp. Iso805N TaxID=1283287 RepID=UPI000382F0B1|nr:nitroreductase/quinone reductase family protein [Nocardioides sp. Iso805N]
MAADYARPGWFTQRVFNPAVRWLTNHGVSLKGSRVLEVRGRKSGEPRQTAVNLLTLDGATYLYAPRGLTEWVRNVRAAGGEAATILGKRREEWTALEVTDPEEYVATARAYLKAWAWEVGAFFPKGISATSSDADLLALASTKPAFRLTARHV